MALAIGAASVDATGLILTVPITGGVSPILPATDVEGFSVLVNGAGLAIDSGTATGATITLNLFEPVRDGDIVRLSYLAADGNVTDSTPVTPLVLADSPNNVVTNNSTVDIEQINTNIGANSVLGWGIESVEGEAVEAQGLLDRTNGSVDATMTTIPRGSYRNNPSVAGFVAGTTKAEGQIQVEPTPSAILPMLMSLLGNPVSVTEIPKGSGGDPQCYTYVFKDGFKQRSLTLPERQGESTFLNIGCKASALSITTNKTQNETVRFAFTMMVLNQLLGFTDTELGLDLAGYDTYEPFGPTAVFFTYNSVLTTRAENVTLNLSKTVGERQVLDGKRGPQSHYCQQSAHAGSATLLFSGEDELNTYFGLAHNATGKRGASRVVKDFPIEWKCTQDEDQYGNVLQVAILYPKATFDRVGQPYAGPGAIQQNVNLITAQSTSAGTALQVTVTSYQPPSALVAGSVITGVPANAVNDYTS